MKQLFSILLGMIIPFCYANAQMNRGTDYKTSLGVKFRPGAISVKHFMKHNLAIEGLWSISADGVRFTGLYEIHKTINRFEGLKFFMGGGGHLGIWSDTYQIKYPASDGGLALGIDGVIGLDYKIKGVPLNLSFDWQPSINIIGNTYYDGGLGGLGVRYTF